jgi:hypothetical protein
MFAKRSICLVSFVQEYAQIHRGKKIRRQHVELPGLFGGVRWFVGDLEGREVFIEQLGDGGVSDKVS